MSAIKIDLTLSYTILMLDDGTSIELDVSLAHPWNKDILKKSSKEERSGK